MLSNNVKITVSHFVSCFFFFSSGGAGVKKKVIFSYFSLKKKSSSRGSSYASVCKQVYLVFHFTENSNGVDVFK